MTHASLHSQSAGKVVLADGELDPLAEVLVVLMVCTPLEKLLYLPRFNVSIFKVRRLLLNLDCIGITGQLLTNRCMGSTWGFSFNKSGWVLSVLPSMVLRCVCPRGLRAGGPELGCPSWKYGGCSPPGYFLSLGLLPQTKHFPVQERVKVQNLGAHTSVLSLTDLRPTMYPPYASIS